MFSGYLIDHTGLWAGAPRNVGIEKAKNDIVCYLDVDDMLMPTHCDFIVTHFGNSDWVWFDDWIYSQRSGWKQRKCDVEKKGFCGTSNIAHKKIKIWPDKGNYAHDFVALQNLKKWSSNYKYIGHGGYRVAHIPGKGRYIMACGCKKNKEVKINAPTKRTFIPKGVNYGKKRSKVQKMQGSRFKTGR